MIKSIWIILFLLSTFSCTMKVEKHDISKLKKEIAATENSFAEMAKNEGIKAAFLYFAAPDAVLSRQNKLYKGREAISSYFDDHPMPYTGIQLEWSPEYIDVSESGDLAYTYGPYTFNYMDTSGIKNQDTGFFHTVWKRQADGKWLYVWD